MKNQLIIFAIIILFIYIGLSGCNGFYIGVTAKRLDREPDNFVNITEEQMQNFPHLKEAILLNKTIEITDSNEETKLRGVLEYFDTYFICYQNEYYEIYFSCS